MQTSKTHNIENNTYKVNDELTPTDKISRDIYILIARTLNGQKVTFTCTWKHEISAKQTARFKIVNDD